MFKKKKIEEPIQEETPVEPEVVEPEVVEPETPDLEVDTESLEEADEEPKPEVEEESTPEIELPEHFMRILAGQILEGGFIQYTVVSNKSIGEIGQIIEL